MVERRGTHRTKLGIRRALHTRTEVAGYITIVPMAMFAVRRRFELTYWRLGLKIASEWRTRAHLPPKPEWADTLKRLAEPTTVPGRDNYSTAYAINGNCYGFPHSAVPKAGQHKCSGAYQSHPLFLGALGMINGAAVHPPLDSQTFNSTLSYSIAGWDWSGTWGWDYPLWAFAQMRMGWDSSSVVDMLLRNETKNFYWSNGHDYETPSLPVYLPGNGGLLSAVAMMAGGFMDGEGKPVEVGFPKSWRAAVEGFKPYP
jgi:protein-glucosylgalactosylhydroxylysine glucosidase